MNGVLDRLFGKTQGAAEEKPEATSEGVSLVARMAAEIATMEAGQKQATSELEAEKQKVSGLQTKYDSAMSTLRAGTLRMAVRAYGAEGAQIEMAKATIEASDDPSVLGKLMESCEKAVPASLASADGTNRTQTPETATSEQKAEKYAKIREQGLKANASKTGGAN